MRSTTRTMKRYTEDFMSLWRCPKPTIAKVHGAAVAGGSDIALCCDLLVMADDARIGYMPTRVWGCPTTAMWTYRLGPTRAKQLMFTGDVIDGRTAADWGLANQAVPAGRAGQPPRCALAAAHRRRATRPPGRCTSWWSTRCMLTMGLEQIAACWPRCSTASRATTPRACGSGAMRRTHGFKAAVAVARQRPTHSRGRTSCIGSGLPDTRGRRNTPARSPSISHFENFMQPPAVSVPPAQAGAPGGAACCSKESACWWRGRSRTGPGAAQCPAPSA
jgi:enoyl-CoA hydratase/carnithine racemase